MLLKAQEIILNGSPICRGIAIGKPFFLNRDDFAIFEMYIPPALTQREIERYHHALSRTKQDLKRLQKQLEMESAIEGIQILEAQLEMLQDPLLTIEIERGIEQTKKNAEFVFQQALLNYQERFQAINDSFFRERFKDIQDLSRRIFGYLNESGNLSLNDVPAHSIVCAEELTASDVASVNAFLVSAFVTETGGATAHAAIIAKAKGIPYLTNIHLKSLREKAPQSMIVDACSGSLILNPSQDTLNKYKQIDHQIQRQVQVLKKGMQWPAQTFDGYTVRLCANLDGAQEAHLVHELGGAGVGLFRSEYIFLPKNEIPSEDEQFKIYSGLVKQMHNLPIVIRTFDLGGDKAYLHNSFSADRNPFVGCRATRFLLKEQELFKTQLRAILRASLLGNGNVSILLPMIATLSEFREAKRLIEEIRQELKLFHAVRIGCMIEVPSAAMIVDHFAQECDFFSIGTNDLVQYALAVDRSDQASSEFYEPTDPSIIRFIKLITSEANKAQIPVSVCGEIASDPRFTAVLLGLGIQELSVAPRYLPFIKNAIRHTSIVDAVYLAEKALSLKTAQEVLDLITTNYRRTFPEDPYYNHL